MIDYHIHTVRCGHAAGQMHEYVERAVRLSLSEIGFADHLPLLTHDDATLTMSAADLPGYVEEVIELQQRYSEISIKLGIEADFIPGLEAQTAEMLRAYPFDYVIGSIHFIDGWGFDDSRNLDGYSERDIYDIYADYYTLVGEAANSGLFDIIGHIDLVKKYNFQPEQDFSGLVRGAVDAIAKAGLCAEINTSGLRKPAAEIYPEPGIVKMLYDAGVPIVLGSDAHEPADVGRDFDRAREIAQDAGYTETVVFTGRKRSFKAL